MGALVNSSAEKLFKRVSLEKMPTYPLTSTLAHSVALDQYVSYLLRSGSKDSDDQGIVTTSIFHRRNDGL